MVILVTLTGGTEEVVMNWAALGLTEVTDLLTAPPAGSHLTVALLSPAALAETELDAGS